MSKSDRRDIVAEAVADAAEIKDAVLSAAQQQIVEDLSPAIKLMLEKNLKRVLNQNEDSDRLRRGVQDNWPGESHTGFEEAKNKGEPKMDPKMMDAEKKDGDKAPEMDLESLAAFFPSMSEMPSEDPEADKVSEDPAAMSGIPNLGEGEDEGGEDDEKEDKKEKEVAEAKKDDDKEKDMDESIEISEAEIKKVYEQALALEAQVKKGFSEMTPNGELDDVVKDADKGLADVKKGEHNWEKETPPAKQDFTVKEMIQRGLAENRALKQAVTRRDAVIRQLTKSLSETNLFNAKILHTTRLLNKHRLTTEQKKSFMESIDKAKTIDQVTMVYETIEGSLKTISESRTRPAINSQRPAGSAGANKQVLRESVDNTTSDAYARLRSLAGLGKK